MISNKSKSKSNAKNTKYSVKSNITTRSQRNATNLSSSTTPNTSAALTDDTNIPNDNTTNTSKTKTKPKQTLKQKQSAASSSKHNVSTISFSTPHNASSSKKTVKTVNSTNKKIDFEELTARIETVEAQNQTLLDQIESLKCSIATLNTTTSPSCNSCKEQFNTLTSRIHDVETENKILRDQITNLNDAIVSVKTNIPEISAAAKPKPTPTSFRCSNLDVSHDVDLIDLTSADDDLLSKPIQRSDSLCQNTPSREVAGHKNMDNVTSNQSLIDSNFALDQSYSYDLTHLNLLSNVNSTPWPNVNNVKLFPCLASTSTTPNLPPNNVSLESTFSFSPRNIIIT
ncbi:hypothetical protein M8J75_014225 [Diaphorina citri]|nr:hypothetical protein M8J75_014225 [Diaphorina citri]